MKEIKYYIYTLNHPITGEIKYLGKTTQKLIDRLNNHVNHVNLKTERGGYRDKTYRANWIRKLINEGLKPTIKYFCECDNEDEQNDFEKFWIAKFREIGVNLTNSTDGGEGTLGYKHSDETKRRMSESMKGDKNHFRGKKLTDDHKQKISEAQKGENNHFFGKPTKSFCFGDDNIAKIPEIRKKISDSKKGDNNPMKNPEVAKKMSETKKQKLLDDADYLIHMTLNNPMKNPEVVKKMKTTLAIKRYNKNYLLGCT